MTLDDIAGAAGIETDILTYGLSEEDATVMGKIILFMKEKPKHIILEKLRELITIRTN